MHEESKNYHKNLKSQTTNYIPPNFHFWAVSHTLSLCLCTKLLLLTVNSHHVSLHVIVFSF